MKYFTLFCLLAFTSLFRAQTLSQSANEPKPGDLESTYALDTSAYSTGLPLNVTGNTAVWNFQNLKASQPALDTYYLSASSNTASTNYPGCTFVQESPGTTTFFKSTTTPTTQTEVLGVENPAFSANFTNSGIVARYPISFGSTSSDNLSGTFSFSTTSGTCNGNITTTADGLGTLNLPEGISLTNVLRVKSVQTISVTILFSQVATIKQTIYNFYSTTQKFPVLSINYEYISSAFTSTPTQTGFVTGSINYFVTGLRENRLNEASIALYPNPAQDHLTVECKDNVALVNVNVFNQMGQLVLTPGNTKTIDISGLNNGLYTIEIVTDKGVSRKKIVRE